MSWNKPPPTFKEKIPVYRRFVIAALLNILLIAIVVSVATSNLSIAGRLDGLDVLLGNEVRTEFVPSTDENSGAGFDLFNVQASTVPICVGNLEEYKNTVIGINLTLTGNYQDAVGAAAIASQATPGTQEYEEAIVRYNAALQGFETIHDDWASTEHPSCMNIPLLNDHPIKFYWEESFDSYVRSVQGYITMIAAKDQGNTDAIGEGYSAYLQEESMAEWNNGFFFGQMFLLFELQETSDA